MPEQNLIDTGARSVGLAFDMGNLGPGETKSFHIKGEHLLGGLPVKDHDLFNPTSIETKVQGPVRCGVTFHHDADGTVPIATGSRVVHIDSTSGDASAFHYVSGAMTNLHLHDHSLEGPTENVVKRCQPKWSGMTTENISNGVFKVEKTAADGSMVSKFVATPTAGNLRNPNNAIHTLISSNEANSRFFGGKFAKSKVDFNGHKDCYVLDAADHNALKTQLEDALSQKSPFTQGLCCTVTNLDRKSGDGPTVVQCKINRAETAAKLEGAGTHTFDAAAGPTQANLETGKAIFSGAKDTDSFKVTALNPEA